MPSIKRFIVMSKEINYEEGNLSEDIYLPDSNLHRLYVEAWESSPSPSRESRWRAVQVGLQLKPFMYGFFCMILAFGWLLYHKLWSKFFLSVIAFLLVGIIIHASSLSRPIFYHWLLMQLFWGWVAYKSNYWMLLKWHRSGYKVVGIVDATTPEEAVGRYLEKRLNEPTIEVG